MNPSHASGSGTKECISFLLRLVLVVGVTSVIVVLGLAWTFRGWSIGGPTDPVLLEVFELESEAHAAELRGDIGRAITVYNHAILRCADSEHGPLTGERAACNAALAKIYEARRDWAAALRHYEAFSEDWRGGGFDDVIHCRVELYGVAELEGWISNREPGAFKAADYLRVQEYYIGRGHPELAAKHAIAFLGDVRLPDDVEAFLINELPTDGGASKKSTTSRAKQRALDTLAWAQLELGAFKEAERAAKACIAFAEDRMGLGKSSRLSSAKFDKRSAFGRAVLARIAFDAGEEDTWRLLLSEATAADPAIGSLPLLSGPMAQR